MTDWIYKIEFIGRDAAGVQVTFKYATKGYSTGPAAASPNAYIEGRLVQPLLLQKDLYGPARAYGDIGIPHGEVTLLNEDGALDTLLNYGFDTQRVKLWRIDPANLDVDFYLEFYGVMEQLTFNRSTVTILVRDYMYIIDRPLQNLKYAGSNVLPNGLEGTTGDIKGHPKPVCLGTCKNIEPILVNSSRLIYQFHWTDFPNVGLNAAIDVFDNRWPLTFGRVITFAELQAGATIATVASVTMNSFPDKMTCTAPHGFTSGDPVHVASTEALPAPLNSGQYYYVYAPTATDLQFYTSQADALIGHPTNWIDLTSVGKGVITVAKNRTIQGGFDACSTAYIAGAGGSFVRLGSSPAGRITMDVASTNSAWDQVVAAMDLSGIPVNVMTIPGMGINVGFYWTEEINCYQALQEVFRTANASFQLYPLLPTGNLYLGIGRLNTPGVTARLELTDKKIFPGSFQRLQPQDQERGIPPWRINLNFARNFTVMSATELPLDQFVIYGTPYKTKKYEDAAVLVKFPTSPEITMDTGISDEASADTQGAYLSGLLSNSTRGVYACRISLQEIFPLPALGLVDSGLVLTETVKVTYPRFGFNAGKFLVLIGLTLDYQNRTADLMLWG